MPLKTLQRGLVLALVILPITGSLALAQLVFPSFAYRTGPYAPNGIPAADGFLDYFALINARDGGINGQKAEVISCETGYNSQRGVECYEKVKAKNPLVIHPLSTGLTYQLIPKATADKIPIHSMGYGRTSAANGKVFKYVFSFPGTYWDAASIIVKYIGREEGGMKKLKGKKISLIYHNSAYGKEPIRTLQVLSKKHGFKLDLLPVDHPGQEQRSTWLKIRRSNPRYLVIWGWGVMNQVALREAASIRFPMKRFIGVWWSGSENDVIPAGKGAHGYKAITFHGVGKNYPVYDDLEKYVYDKGKAAGDGDNMGTVLYNRGMLSAMWSVEGARSAMKIHKTKKITPAMMRDGMEALHVGEKRLKELGMAGFTVTVKNSCARHGGPGLGAIQQWNANTKQWKLITEYIGADRVVVDKLVAEDSAAYAKENKIEVRSCS